MFCRAPSFIFKTKCTRFIEVDFFYFKLRKGNNIQGKRERILCVSIDLYYRPVLKILQDKEGNFLIEQQSL